MNAQQKKLDKKFLDDCIASSAFDVDLVAKTLRNTVAPELRKAAAGVKTIQAQRTARGVANDKDLVSLERALLVAHLALVNAANTLGRLIGDRRFRSAPKYLRAVSDGEERKS